MASPRLHRSSTIQSAINAAVFQAIFDEHHFIDPPKLSPELWERVSIQAPTNRAESERLEFLGDALMDACIATELYKTIPDGTPHKYTVRASYYLVLPLPILIAKWRSSRRF